MKTIYIKTKKSGNFEFSNRENADMKFTTKKAFKKWFETDKKGRLIKATYSQSQTYFRSSFDFETAWFYAKKRFN